MALCPRQPWLNKFYDWNGLWEDWESWFRNIGETHGLAPVLAFVPTVHRGQTWLAAAAVALDSASFYLSAIEAQGALSAVVCHRTGVDALRLVADPFAGRYAASELQGGRRLSRSDFDLACDSFAALGAKVRAERESCWLRFVELRQEYEELLQRLAKTLLAPTSDSYCCRLRLEVVHATTRHCWRQSRSRTRTFKCL